MRSLRRRRRATLGRLGRIGYAEAMSASPPPLPPARSEIAAWHRGMQADPQLLDCRRTSAEFAAARPEMALLPLGATEQHGAHLPCGTDTFQVDYLADEIARRLPIWRLPTIPITVSHMHPGS